VSMRCRNRVLLTYLLTNSLTRQLSACERFVRIGDSLGRFKLQQFVVDSGMATSVLGGGGGKNSASPNA